MQLIELVEKEDKDKPTDNFDSDKARDKVASLLRKHANSKYMKEFDSRPRNPVSFESQDRSYRFRFPKAIGGNDAIKSMDGFVKAVQSAFGASTSVTDRGSYYQVNVDRQTKD